MMSPVRSSISDETGMARVATTRHFVLTTFLVGEGRDGRRGAPKE